MSRLIGLTGGIGSGKSVLSRILRINGYYVYDCDLEARRIMDESGYVSKELKSRWGNDIYDNYGRLDRKRVAACVFNDNAERLWLNSLVHGLVRDDVRKWMEGHKDIPLLFVESAILCTSGLAGMCQEVWEVTAPENVRVKRIEARNGLTREEAMCRISAQSQESEQLHNLENLRQISNSGEDRLLDQLYALLENQKHD